MLHNHKKIIITTSKKSRHEKRVLKEKIKKSKKIDNLKKIFYIAIISTL